MRGAFAAPRRDAEAETLHSHQTKAEPDATATTADMVTPAVAVGASTESGVAS
jgi:hypothetical protein